MQTITLEQVKEAARKAYEAGTLTAQLSPDNAYCKYHIGNARCAVGACLTDETLKEIDKRGINAQHVGMVIAKGVVAVENPDEVQEIVSIQVAHDNWCQEVQAENYPAAEKDRAVFCKLIDIPVLSKSMTL